MHGVNDIYGRILAATLTWACGTARCHCWTGTTGVAEQAHTSYSETDASWQVLQRRNMHRRASLLLSGVAGVLALSAHAATLDVCIADRDYPPLFFLDHDGQAQWLVRKALERQHDMVNFISVPWRRCLEGLRSGQYAAALPVAANPAFLPLYAFPMQHGQVDRSVALQEVVHVAVRRVGSNADWDGSRFANLTMPVVYPSGIVIVRDWLAARGVAADDGTRSDDAALRKLMAGRANLAIIQSALAEQLLAQDEFRGRLEILPTPVLVFSVYLAFNRAFFEAAPAYPQALWKELKRLRGTPEWKTLAPALAH